MPRRWPYHLLAVVVVLTWGVTFVNSKVLLNHGMQAHEIFFVRFLLAYACIWLISPHKLWADNVADELRLVVLGITGGSLYFITENGFYYDVDLGDTKLTDDDLANIEKEMRKIC